MIVLPAIYHVMILTHKIMTCAGSLYATAFRWWGIAVHAEEENEELRQAIYEPFSLPYQDLCKENMELKFRIMDLQEALAGITGSTEAAEAAEHLGGQHSMNLPRETQLIIGHAVQELYEAKFGAGSFSGTSHRQDERRPCELEDEGTGPGPSSRSLRRNSAGAWANRLALRENRNT